MSRKEQGLWLLPRRGRVELEPWRWDGGGNRELSTCLRRASHLMSRVCHVQEHVSHASVKQRGASLVRETHLCWQSPNNSW
jgi:hypothetical protein